MAKKKTKKLKVLSTVQSQMGESWKIEVSEKAFLEGKGLNMPALGYPCASCASKETKICFAESTDEEESSLLWMELQCKDCKAYTMYSKKE